MVDSPLNTTPARGERDLKSPLGRRYAVAIKSAAVFPNGSSRLLGGKALEIRKGVCEYTYIWDQAPKICRIITESEYWRW